ncbi:14576_t:CDS:1, partial [Cetraspora pellucida]
IQVTTQAIQNPSFSSEANYASKLIKYVSSSQDNIDDISIDNNINIEDI